jgi:N4-gp56 family major capsid protein
MGEVGKVENTRFILTRLFSPWLEAGENVDGMMSDGAESTSGGGASEQADVYPVIFLAANAYGIVPFQGSGAVTTFIKNPGEATKGDELAQTGFTSWKTQQASVILNEDWIVRLEVTASWL